jgi:hypothetical protein
VQLGRIVVGGTRTARAARGAALARIGGIQAHAGLARIDRNHGIRIDRGRRLARRFRRTGLALLTRLTFARPFAAATSTETPARAWSGASALTLRTVGRRASPLRRPHVPRSGFG